MNIKPTNNFWKGEFADPIWAEKYRYKKKLIGWIKYL